MLRESSGGAKNDRWFDSSYDCNLYASEDNSSAQPSFDEDCKHVGQCAEGEGFCDVGVKFTAELERAHETGHWRCHCAVAVPLEFAVLLDGANTYVCYAPRVPYIHTPNNLYA